VTYGHALSHSKPAAAEARLREYLRNPKIAKRLADMEAGKVPVDNDHDLPFLSGTTGRGSDWGLAFDRHLPATLDIGGKKIDPRLFLRWHEAFERSLMDVYGMPYLRAHVFATLLEHQKLDAAGVDHTAYEKALKPFIDSSEAEKIIHPPARLDKRPYQQDHDQSDNAKAIRRRLAAA